MPTYEYECAACNHTFEVLQTMLEPKLKTCPVCQRDELHRLIGTGGGIIFKGTGFYETDYKKITPAKSASPQASPSPKEAPSCAKGQCGCHSSPAKPTETKSSNP